MSADPRQHEIGRSVLRAVLVTNTGCPSRDNEHIMRRLAVPRGNEWVTVPPPFDLTPTSPFWESLSSEERTVAEQTRQLRPLMKLCMAERALLASLIDLRLVRTFKDWKVFSDRLMQVKKAVFGERTDATFRADSFTPCRVRLILLGAKREEASSIAMELVDHVVELRSAGEWVPDAVRHPWAEPSESDIRHWARDSAGHRARAAESWKEDAKKLGTSRSTWSRLFLDDELRAFADDPPQDPFCAAQKFVVKRSKMAMLPAHSYEAPAGFTRQSVEYATNHIKGLVLAVRHLIQLAANPLNLDFESADHVAISLDDLTRDLRSAWVSPSLLEAFHRISTTNYQIANVVKPSVHEALEEVARRVFFAYQNAIASVAFPDGKELDRMFHGPWHGHEVEAALGLIGPSHPELLTAFGSVELQTHLANLERESALLLVAADPRPLNPPSKIVEGETPPTGPLDLPAEPPKGVKPLADEPKLTGEEKSIKDKLPARDSNKPGRDRQSDILTAIRTAGNPLTRPELVEAMRLKTEGKLGANLAWMVANEVLTNIPQRGYWPFGESAPH